MNWKITILTLALVLALLPASFAQQSQRDQSAPMAQQPPDSQSQATSFTGTIVKDGNKLVLKTAASEIYQLDDQQHAKQFEGKEVTITGSVDGKAKKMTIHVQSIQPAT
jgi:uncharacterized protein YdeI (BOF family)